MRCARLCIPLTQEQTQRNKQLSNSISCASLRSATQPYLPPFITHSSHIAIPPSRKQFCYQPQLLFANTLNRNYSTAVYKLKPSCSSATLCVFLPVSCADWRKLCDEILPKGSWELSGFPADCRAPSALSVLPSAAAARLAAASARRAGSRFAGPGLMEMRPSRMQICPQHSRGADLGLPLIQLRGRGSSTSPSSVTGASREQLQPGRDQEKG